MFLCWPLRSSSQASAGWVGPGDCCAAAFAGSAITPAMAVPIVARRVRNERRTTVSGVEVLMAIRSESLELSEDGWDATKLPHIDAARKGQQKRRSFRSA